MTCAADTDNADHIGALWNGLDPRTRSILDLRLQGFTLDEIGKDLHLTRERVRQLEKKGRASLKVAVSMLLPALPEQLEELAGDAGVISIKSAKDRTGTDCAPGISVFMQSVGFKPCTLWGKQLPGWWAKDLTNLLNSLNDLIKDAPFRGDEIAARCSASNIPAEFPIEEALSLSGSGILQDKSGGWIRRSSKSADSAYLWLSERVEPAEAEEIAAEIGATSARALTEVMRRNADRFTQIRPEGTWALRDWNYLAGPTYKGATEAVIDVLRDLGPLTLQQLIAETIRRYPVTAWRVGQCVYSSDVGETAEGRYDLIIRGATPILPQVPDKPSYMAESGNKIAVKLSVNPDLLRGSGIGVSLWLTWRLGLHSYPSQTDFNAGQTLTIRRHSSGASISSLRTFAQGLRLERGCYIIVILDTETLVAKVRHGCSAECPNFVP